MHCFIDTGAWFALLLPHEIDHNYAQEGYLVLPSYPSMVQETQAIYSI